MTFSAAVERTRNANITLADIAAACKVSRNLIEKARMDPDNPNARRPPEGWRACVAKLCRQRAMDLLKLADSLEPSEG
ncbi:MAG TPA: hypothetical protein VMM79_04585 [Longimicrobiales bacterium]|nr:hypothetical protein [Longimicrobiales bacterium]